MSRIQTLLAAEGIIEAPLTADGRRKPIIIHAEKAPSSQKHLCLEVVRSGVRSGVRNAN